MTVEGLCAGQMFMLKRPGLALSPPAPAPLHTCNGPARHAEMNSVQLRWLSHQAGISGCRRNSIVEHFLLLKTLLI